MFSLRFFVCSTLAAALPLGVASAQTRSITDLQRSKAIEDYGKLPLAFEANRGQTDSRVKFLARGEGYTAFLTDSEAVMVLRSGTKFNDAGSKNTLHGSDRIEDTGSSSILRMRISGASPNPKIQTLEELEGHRNYFIGNDPQKWRSDVPLYKKVRFESVYPGIDLLYYGTQGQLEYDFVISPHADPNRIQLTFSGANRLFVDEKGDLQIDAGTGKIIFHKPAISQHENGVLLPVRGAFKIVGDKVSFDLGKYDRDRELIIDPSLIYATYLSGGTSDSAQAITVDNSGYAYITGWTESTDFPTTAGAYRTTSAGGQDIFITKLNTTGSGLVYSTYLGGSQDDYSYGIVLDSADNAYITGYTFSENFPTTPGAFQQCSSNSYLQGFVTKLNSTGSALAYSTCFAAYEVQPQSIAVDDSGSAYITGYANGSIPVTPGAFQTASGGSVDAFVAKFTPDGTALEYSTYLGGSGNDYGYAITVDSAGSAYVTGATSSQNFPTTASAFRSTFQGGGDDAFVTKLNAAGTGLVYSTYLGGSGDDYGYAIVVDSAGSSYVGGNTQSINNFPITPGAYRTNYSGAYLTKFSADGSGIEYSTYLGNGNQYDRVSGLSVDSSKDAYYLRYYGLYLETLSADGSTLLSSFSTSGAYLNGIALDSSGASYGAGSTCYGCGFVATPGAFQTAPNNTNQSGMALKLSPLSAPVVYLSANTLNFGSEVVNTTSSPIAVTLTNQGESPLAISSIVASGDYAQTNNCGNSLGSEASCTIIITFTPTVVGTRSGSVTITDNNGGSSGSQQTIALTGIGIAPIVNLSSTNLSFGNQAVGTMSAAQKVTLSNIGNATLTISSIVATGDFSETNTCGGSVAVGAKCTISVAFTPSASGTRTGTIGITDNANDSPQYIYLTGTGIGGSPIATLSASSLTFSGQAVGTTSAAQSVSLTNTGSVSLDIGSIASSGDFSQTNNCPSSLASNSTCTISVTFTPTVSGTRTGMISITDNAANSPQSVSLSGTGLAPLVSLSASSVTFGNQQVGTVSTAQNVTLTNSGNSALAITSITAAGDFAQTNNCGSSVAAGANCSIAITFAPSALGLRIGSVTITDNSSGSPQSISLQGTGVAPFVSLSATTLSFGNQIVNTTSPQQTVTMTNSGTGALLNISFATTGDFAQSNNCGTSLGAGLSCAILVTFTPTITGNENGSVSISDSAPGSPQQITLSGTGVPAVAVSPSSLSFALQLLNTISATQLVTLTNYQTVPVNIGTITPSGPFSETDNCANTQLPAGGTCSINVAFIPNSIGSFSGTLVVSDNGPGSSPTVQLQGASSGVVSNGFVGVSSMGIPRAQHAATLLSNGDVLVTGGAPTTVGQLYNPSTTAFTPTANNMSTARTWHMSRQISKGNVIVLGGVDSNGNYLASADLYNYKTNKFAPTGSMSMPRAMPTATWLSTPGTLLVTGGLSASDSTGPLASAELYNAATGQFTPTGSMYTPRYNHAASELQDGTVLVTGGRCDPSPNCAPDVGISAEIYNPATGAFTRIGNMNVSRVLHTSTSLNDGTVLITGGFIGDQQTAEIYNPTTQTFTLTATEMVGGSLVEHRATPLSTSEKGTSQILITGGNDTAEAQIYDPPTQTFTAVGSMTIPRSFHTATPVVGGVIVTGGSDEPCEGVLRSCPQQWASAELYTLSTLTVTVSPSSLSFGGEAVGNTSASQNVTVTNTGTGQVSISSVAATSGFEIHSDQCQNPIQPGSSCTLAMVFAPVALGPVSGTLTITDNATGSPQTVALSGTGTTTTTTALSSSINPSTYGQPLTLSATVTPAIAGNPTGSVTFYDGTLSIGSGSLSGSTATLTLSSLTAGSHSLTAAYSGDGTFGPSTSPVLTQTVVQAGVSMMLTSSMNPSSINQPVTFTVVVTGSGPATPTGTATFKAGTTTLGSAALSGGQANLTTTFTKSESVSIVVSYSGDQNYKAQNSKTLKQVVDKYSTTTALTSSQNPSTYGANVTFSATVVSAGPTPTGTVTFKDGSKAIGSAPLVKGTAEISTTGLAVGSLNITATYNGDSDSAKSTSSVLKQVVNKASSSTTVTSSPNPSKSGQAVKFVADVTSPTTTPKGTVAFLDGTTTMGTATIASGKATFSTSSLSTGSHNITAVYQGSADVAGSTSPVLIQVVN